MSPSKIPAYVRHRLSGLAPVAAARAAGYSAAGISVAAARLESREDVRQALRHVADGSVPAVRVYRIGDGDAELRLWGLRDQYDEPLDLLLDVMNNPAAPAGVRIQCARDALPYCHARGAGPKKENTTADATSREVRGHCAGVAPKRSAT